MHLRDYSYSRENKILTIYNKGVVTFDSFMQSWLDAYHNNMIPKDTVGFVYINMDTAFDFSVADYKKIMFFFTKYPAILQGRRIAWVSNLTKNSLIPAAIALRNTFINSGYSVQPFNNIRDAEKWVIHGDSI